MHRGVGRTDGGVLAEKEQPAHLAVQHLHEIALLGLVPAQLGQVLVAVLVGGGGGLAVPRLQEADHGGGHGRPRSHRALLLPEAACGLAPSGLKAVPVLEHPFQRGVIGVGHRLGQIIGKGIEECRDVRRALHVGVPAQGDDPAAGPPDVAEEQLNDACGADDLRPGGVLGPAKGVSDGGGVFPARVRDKLIGHPLDFRGLTAADRSHPFWRIAGVVRLKNPQDAAGMLERRIKDGPPFRV